MKLKAIDIDQYGSVRQGNEQDSSESGIDAPVSNTSSPTKAAQPLRQRRSDGDSVVEGGMYIEFSNGANIDSLS